MGLFNALKPKMSPHQVQHAKGLLKQARESAQLVNTTVKPDVFFGRLNFLLDVLLELKEYEKYKGFSGSTPSKDYSDVVRGLEKTVNSFIARACQNQQAQISALKTDKAKINRIQKFSTEMLSAFENANSFWQGNNRGHHYTGALYTPANLERLNRALSSLRS